MHGTKVTQPTNKTFQIWDNHRPLIITKWPEPGHYSMQGTDVTKSMKRKNKRQRTAFTTDNLRVLEEVFSHKKYIDRLHRIELARSVNVDEKAIKVWFQNRRMKEKKEKNAVSWDTATDYSNTISQSYFNMEHFSKQTVDTKYPGNNLSNYQTLHEHYYCMNNESRVSNNLEVFFHNANQTDSTKCEGTLNEQHERQLNVLNAVDYCANQNCGSNVHYFGMLNYCTNEQKSEKCYTNQIDDNKEDKIQVSANKISELIPVNYVSEYPTQEQTANTSYYESNFNNFLNLEMCNNYENGNKIELTGFLQDNNSHPTQYYPNNNDAAPFMSTCAPAFAYQSK